MYTVITDGSACNKSRKGGWAAIVRNSTSLIELTGWAEDTTSNRMELMAAIEALRSIPTPSDITLVTDSAYLRNTMKRRWYDRWFLEDKKKDRPNMDLWEILAGLAAFHNITWVKVKGHSGDFWNERVDKLAEQARLEKLVIRNTLGDLGIPCPNEYFSKTCRLYIGHSGDCQWIKDIGSYGQTWCSAT